MPRKKGYAGVPNLVYACLKTHLREEEKREGTVVVVPRRTTEAQEFPPMGRGLLAVSTLLRSRGKHLESYPFPVFGDGSCQPLKVWASEAPTDLLRSLEARGLEPEVLFGALVGTLRTALGRLCTSEQEEVFEALATVQHPRRASKAVLTRLEGARERAGEIWRRECFDVIPPVPGWPPPTEGLQDDEFGWLILSRLTPLLASAASFEVFSGYAPHAARLLGWESWTAAARRRLLGLDAPGRSSSVGSTKAELSAISRELAAELRARLPLGHTLAQFQIRNGAW